MLTITFSFGMWFTREEVEIQALELALQDDFTYILYTFVALLKASSRFKQCSIVYSEGVVFQPPVNII